MAGNHGNSSIQISIHAPARGATSTSVRWGCIPGTFQSTLPRGERQTTRQAWDNVYLFQSTLPRGERRLPQDRQKLATDFNPRSREGSDRNTTRYYALNGNFNPRSREGSDQDPCPVMLEIIKISIHAPARGATLISSYPQSL